MRLALVTPLATRTDTYLAGACPAAVHGCVLTPEQALRDLVEGDVAVGRLDVLPTLDGIADGLWALGALEARGVRVLNAASALLAAHDKLLTARLLHAAGLPHPRTIHVSAETPELRWRGPVVVKPRFGSWGRDVTRCTSPASLRARLDIVEASTWFRRHGALVQELVPPAGHDLRVVVAGGRAIGSVRRVAAPGEWRTNIALGGRREPAVAPRKARDLALAAVEVVAADLAGVDMVPDGRGGWTILEVNGAVEFTAEYGEPVFGAAVDGLLTAAQRPGSAPLAIVADRG